MASRRKTKKTSKKRDKESSDFLWGYFDKERYSKAKAKSRVAGRRSRSRKTHAKHLREGEFGSMYNPVRIIGSVAGKSTGWIKSKATRVVKTRGGYKVEVKR